MKLIYPFLIIIALCFVSGSELYAQTIISYNYDDAGNRVQRKIVLNTQAAQSTKSDSISKEKKKVYEENVGDQKVRIYPNPTRGQILVEISGYDKNANSGLYLYNLSGTLLSSISPISGSDPLDLSAYPIGTYILKIVIGNKKNEWKIIKQ